MVFGADCFWEMSSRTTSYYLVDWTCDSEGTKVVTDVALGDFDIACKLKEGETRLTPHAVGNAMWRSPKGSTGISTRASNIYSLGLVVSPAYVNREIIRLIPVHSIFTP